VPACFAGTEELIALARAAGESGGMYIAHIRSEGDRFLEALDEHIAITRAADEAKSSAGAGLDALRRALDNWQLSPPLTPAPTPAPEPPKQDGLIRT
jgi:hypothetical protein